MMKNKSEVIDKLREYVELAENFTGQRVKRIRSDNEQEYCVGGI